MSRRPVPTKQEITEELDSIRGQPGSAWHHSIAFRQVFYLRGVETLLVENDSPFSRVNAPTGAPGRNWLGRKIRKAEDAVTYAKGCLWLTEREAYALHVAAKLGAIDWDDHRSAFRGAVRGIFEAAVSGEGAAGEREGQNADEPLAPTLQSLVCTLQLQRGGNILEILRWIRAEEAKQGSSVHEASVRATAIVEAQLEKLPLVAQRRAYLKAIEGRLEEEIGGPDECEERLVPLVIERLRSSLDRERSSEGQPLSVPGSEDALVAQIRAAATGRQTFVREQYLTDYYANLVDGLAQEHMEGLVAALIRLIARRAAKRKKAARRLEAYRAAKAKYGKLATVDSSHHAVWWKVVVEGLDVHIEAETIDAEIEGKKIRSDRARRRLLADEIEKDPFSFRAKSGHYTMGSITKQGQEKLSELGYTGCSASSLQNAITSWDKYDSFEIIEGNDKRNPPRFERLVAEFVLAHRSNKSEACSNRKA